MLSEALSGFSSLSGTQKVWIAVAVALVVTLGVYLIIHFTGNDDDNDDENPNGKPKEKPKENPKEKPKAVTGTWYTTPTFLENVKKSSSREVSFPGWQKYVADATFTSPANANGNKVNIDTTSGTWAEYVNSPTAQADIALTNPIKYKYSDLQCPAGTRVNLHLTLPMWRCIPVSTDPTLPL